MFCNHCGKEIKNPSKFCTKCGAKIGEGAFTNDTDENTIIENKVEKIVNEESKVEENDIADSNNVENNITENFTGDNNLNYPNYDYNNIEKVSNNAVNKNNISVPKRIISIIICIFIVIFTIISSFVCSIRIGFQKDNIRKIISNEDIADIRINDQYLSEYIISNIDQTIITKFKINTTQVDEILSDEQVKDMITNLVTDYTSMFVFGEKPRTLNEDSVVKNIQNLDSLIYSKTGYSMPKEDYADIRKELSEGSLSFLIENNIKDTLKFDPYIISMFFSVPAICILVALDLGLVILLFKVNNWKIKSYFAFLGISFIVSGSLSLCAALFMMVVSFINKMFLVSSLLRSLSINMIIIAAIMFVAGLLLFIIQNKFIKIKR